MTLLTTQEIEDALNDASYTPGDDFSSEQTIGAKKALALIAPLFHRVAEAVAYSFSERSQQSQTLTWEDSEKAHDVLRRVLDQGRRT
jgi:hypothetical protein